MMVQPPQAHNNGKYGKGWYFRFENDNSMGYEHIILHHVNLNGPD